MRDAVSIPLHSPGRWPASWPHRWDGGGPGRWLFVAIVAVASVLALLRLHATGGYCSPRHALILSLLLIPAAASGLRQAIAVVADFVTPPRPGAARAAVGPAWVLVLGGLACFFAPRHGGAGQRGNSGATSAGLWLHERVPPDARVVDVSGWAIFYGRLRATPSRT